MKGQLRDIVLLVCTYIQVTYSRPIQIENFYQFWKTVDKQFIPQTQALQTLISDTIHLFCLTDEIDDAIPNKLNCDDHIQTLSSDLSLPVTPVRFTAVRHINNPNKFMKMLIKNTVTNLDVYDKLVQLMADEYCKSGGNDQDEICTKLNQLSTNLNKLIQSVSSETKQYFHITNVKKQTVIGISIKDRSQVQKVAILYGLFTQLKEAESALEFIVKSTWDVHVRQMTNFQNKKRTRTRKLTRKSFNLGLSD